MTDITITTQTGTVNVRQVNKGLAFIEASTPIINEGRAYLSLSEVKELEASIKILREQMENNNK